MFFLQILGAVLILSFLVFIHELGHFWMAKRNGVKVHEFAIGFPPTFCKKKYGETDYKLNVIPFGGYVKLHGEDSWDPKVLKDKKSFASKTPWQKTEILLGGVLMNFLVFWVLSSVSLMIGTEPLITSLDDLKTQFVEERVDYTPGFVSDIEEFDIEDAYEAYEGNDLQVLSSFVSEGEVRPVLDIPSLKVKNVSVDSIWSNVLKEGDDLLSIAGVPPFDESTVIQALGNSGGRVDYSLVRDREAIVGSFDWAFGYEVSSVFEDSIAEKAGVLPGDRLIRIEDQFVTRKQSVLDLTNGFENDELTYFFERGDESVEIVMSPDANGLVGMYLLPSYVDGIFAYDFAKTSYPITINGIEDLKYPVWKAPFVALNNGWEISKLTAVGFVSTLGDVFFKLNVSEDIGGPVQVAKMSYEFVGVGGTRLMNFIALISLSLAVINILPIPALDGGRLLFVIVEAFRGKPLDRKLESVLHGIGFFMLMGLILVVTIFDLLRL